MSEQKRVAIYARVSTADQTAENQLLDLRGECARRGWAVIEPPYVDVGISGAKEHRPHLDRLMEDVRKRKVDVVFVWRFDRFARSLTHLVTALEYFRQRHIDFASYSENIDTATSQGKLVFSIFAAIAEFERCLIIERIHSGLRRARSEGKRLGRPGLPQSKIAEILALRGKASIRQIAARVGIGRSVVHKVLSTKGGQNVAAAIDEMPVAF
jgi:DNA invertase Pin-like site-specific DNA recombinase